MRKVKILIVTTVPDTINTILCEQLSYLNGYFDVCVATSPTKGISSIENRELVPVYQVKMERGISLLADFISIIKMVALLLKIKPDIVHSYTPKAGLVSMLAGWISFVPVRVHTFTGLIFPTQTGLKKRILILVDKLICACATKIVPEGTGVKNDLLSYGVTDKPLKVIGHGNIAGVNTSYYSSCADNVSEQSHSLKKMLNIPISDFVFCFVGRLNKDKGIAELVNAFVQLPSYAQLILVGELDETAPVEMEIMAIVNKHQRIHHVGFMSDIRPALAASRVLVLPSYREGFPNAILQAGAMKLPVIATDINGCNEVIEDGVNGWLVPVKNSKSLEAAMFNALNSSSDNLSRFGVNARNIIKERYERSEHWLRMVKFYKDIIYNEKII